MEASGEVSVGPRMLGLIAKAEQGFAISDISHGALFCAERTSACFPSTPVGLTQL